MYRFGWQNRFRPEAFAAFAAGVLASYLIQVRLGFGGGTGVISLNTIIVVAVGGLWYHIRKIV